MTSRQQKTDDRITAIIAGAHERAVAGAHAIQTLRERSITKDRTEPKKDGVPRWPMHSVTGRTPGAVLDTSLEAHVTVARARTAAGVPMSDLDRRSIQAHSHKTEYEKAVAEAADRYRKELTEHGVSRNPNAHDVLRRERPRAAAEGGQRPPERLGTPSRVRAVGSARRRSPTPPGP